MPPPEDPPDDPEEPPDDGILTEQPLITSVTASAMLLLTIFREIAPVRLAGFIVNTALITICEPQTDAGDLIFRGHVKPPYVCLERAYSPLVPSDLTLFDDAAGDHNHCDHNTAVAGPQYP
jgi:hypothetical protein